MSDSRAKLSIIKLPNSSTLVIKQRDGNFFLTSRDSIIIDTFGLSTLLKFLVMNDVMSVKVLEGIVGEYYDIKS